MIPLSGGFCIRNYIARRSATDIVSSFEAAHQTASRPRQSISRGERNDTLSFRDVAMSDCNVIPDTSYLNAEIVVLQPVATD